LFWRAYASLCAILANKSYSILFYSIYMYSAHVITWFFFVVFLCALRRVFIYIKIFFLALHHIFPFFLVQCASWRIDRCLARCHRLSESMYTNWHMPRIMDIYLERGKTVPSVEEICGRCRDLRCTPDHGKRAPLGNKKGQRG